MRLFLGMMQKANLMAEEKAPDPAVIETQKEAEKNFTPNRAQRRAYARQRMDQRWDKKLADMYGIPKAFRGHANRYGSSTEMMLSEMLQQGAIKYKEMADGDTTNNG